LEAFFSLESLKTGTFETGMNLDKIQFNRTNDGI